MFTGQAHRIHKREAFQKALDVGRVIGNNAVHPGQIDLKDDRATAEKLFGLVNLIADIMVTQPKHIDAMFQGLPEGARKAIEKRDAPKQIEERELTPFSHQIADH